MIPFHVMFMEKSGSESSPTRIKKISVLIHTDE